MKTSTSNPTKADLERFDRLRELGCVVCRVFRRVPEVPNDVHHRIDGNQRVSHQETAPLCAWHHRGIIPLGYNSISATEKFGPSKARNPAKFEAAYGTDAELIDMTNQLLEAMKKGRVAA